MIYKHIDRHKTKKKGSSIGGCCCWSRRCRLPRAVGCGQSLHVLHVVQMTQVISVCGRHRRRYNRADHGRLGWTVRAVWGRWCRAVALIGWLWSVVPSATLLVPIVTVVSVSAWWSVAAHSIGGGAAAAATVVVVAARVCVGALLRLIHHTAATIAVGRRRGVVVVALRSEIVSSTATAIAVATITVAAESASIVASELH